MKKILVNLVLLTMSMTGFVSCDKNEDEDESNIDYTQFQIINNGAGAVTSITDENDKTPLQIVQTVPSLGGSSYSPSYPLKSSTGFSEKRKSEEVIPLRSGQGSDIGTFPANLPVMFFFNDKIYLNSVKDNIEIIVDGESIKGVITINEGANGYAILTFTPWKEFKVNNSISITVKKEIQDDGGNEMTEDVNITYQTSAGAKGNFDSNTGFEKGLEGVTFIGDGDVIGAKGDLLPQEGKALAAISSGTALVSQSEYAIGYASSMIILGPINKELSGLSFYYDFISAEFDDYVDSEFDDCAMITVSGPKGSYSEFITSVNKIRFDNTAFEYPKMPDGGDSKTGHIGWTSRKINFTNIGSPAYITFTVTDVSDLILSSILAIDNISLQ